MSGRLDLEREARLQPKRMTKAIKEISKLGYEVKRVSETELNFVTDTINGKTVKYFPYSGWATGPSIKDGRGLQKLLRQLK